jgi:hypothetical protein
MTPYAFFISVGRLSTNIYFSPVFQHGRLPHLSHPQADASRAQHVNLTSDAPRCYGIDDKLSS